MKRFLKTTAVAVAAGLIATSAMAADMKKVAISTIVEVPSLLETISGVKDALANRGYVEGETIEIEYQNANGNMPTQQQIAKKFVGGNPDVIIPVTTPTAQAMATATSDIPVVFTAVTDPIKAGLITQYEKPGKNVTGVSDASPIGEQLDFFKQIVPGLKTIGFVYNPGLDNALATLERMEELGAERGITVVTSPAPTTNEVILATKKLIGKVDAIYVPNDTTVKSALEAIIKVGQDVDLPIFTGDSKDVERGTLAAVGLDMYAVGWVTGQIAADVLDGKTVGDIDSVIAYNEVDKFVVAINKLAAERMGVTFTEEVMAQANVVIE
ncbi:ABC transporter substrate-binding protein [Maritalea sp.]|uniref:ABC transporter substrate-binding protein n=1 Tax=Maritalea sp. TaxID=2003361 RepID=UPI003EF7A53A